MLDEKGERYECSFWSTQVDFFWENTCRPFEVLPPQIFACATQPINCIFIKLVAPGGLKLGSAAYFDFFYVLCTVLQGVSISW